MAPFFVVNAGAIARCLVCLDTGTIHDSAWQTTNLGYHLIHEHGIPRPGPAPVSRDERRTIPTMFEEAKQLRQEKIYGAANLVVQCGVPYRAFRNPVFKATTGLRFSVETVQREVVRLSEEMKISCSDVRIQPA